MITRGTKFLLILIGLLALAKIFPVIGLILAGIAKFILSIFYLILIAFVPFIILVLLLPFKLRTYSKTKSGFTRRQTTTKKKSKKSSFKEDAEEAEIIEDTK